MAGVQRSDVLRSVCVVAQRGLLLALLGAAGLACGQQQRADVGPIVRQLQAGDYKQVLQLCKAALAKSPADYRLWTLQGMALGSLNETPQALESYQHALRLSPEYLPALEGAAQTEFQAGRPGARALLEKILTRRPQDQTTHALLGVLDARAGKCENAVGHFENAGAALGHDPEALAAEGVCLAALNRNEDAINAFAELVVVVPASQTARYNLALAQWSAHRADDALATLKSEIESDQPDADALTLAAEIAESQDDTTHAVELLRKALEVDPKHMDAYMSFAALSYDHASPQVGVDMLDFGLHQLPREPRLYLVRGILLTQVGEFGRAADDFAEASRLDPHLQFLAVAEGLVQSQQHHSAEALAQFRAAVKAHPNEAMAHYLLAEALNGEGKQPGTPEYKEELAAAMSAVRLDTNLTAARDLLASIYLENGRTADAIEQSRITLKQEPNDQQAVYHLIVALRKTGDKEQIAPLLKRLMELRADPKGRQDHAKRFRLNVEQRAAK